MDFETPREAVLRAENDRLKAEISYLRNAMNLGEMTVTPIGVVDEQRMPTLPDRLTVPLAATVRGHLGLGNRYHVLARLYLEQPEDLVVSYYAPAEIIKSKADYAVNQLFPYLHERFVRALAGALTLKRLES